MDATPSNSWLTPPDVVRPGETLTLDDDGRPLELRVLDRLPDDRFSALAPRLRVRAGLELTARVFDHERSWHLRYEIEDAELASDDEALVRVVLREAHETGDERKAPRTATVLAGTVSPPAYEGYTFSTTIHTVDLSTSGVAFECDRSFAEGQRLDLSVEDETGSPISGSIEVVRTAPGPHGRVRIMCRFLEIEDGDDEHLAELVEHPPAAEDNGVAPAPDDPELHRPAPVYDFVHGLRDELLSHPPVEEDAEDEDLVEEPARPRWRLGRPR
jgi:PilZ domain